VHTSTSSFNPKRTALAVGGTLVVFFLLRCFFIAFPAAFVAYPETLQEYSFYTAYMRGKTDPPTAQIVLMGTSRFQFMGKREINPLYVKPNGHSLNMSLAGNSFWQVAALRRLNPDLWNNADLVVMDIGAMQIYLGRNFDEKSPLFFRESTLPEKWLIRNPLTRIRALADWIAPAWSHRHQPSTWWKALTHLDNTDAERMDVLKKTPFRRFADFQTWLQEGAEVREDPANRMQLLLEIDYPLGPYSYVQEHALRELADHPPSNGHLLLIHPPHADALQTALMESPDRKHMQPELRSLVDTVVSDRVVLRWFDRADALGLSDEMFTADGIHFGREGVEQMHRVIDSTYRELHRLPPAEPAPVQ
jgi:hypothetical protein